MPRKSVAESGVEPRSLKSHSLFLNYKTILRLLGTWQCKLWTLDVSASGCGLTEFQWLLLEMYLIAHPPHCLLSLSHVLTLTFCAQSESNSVRCQPPKREFTLTVAKCCLFRYVTNTQQFYYRWLVRWICDMSLGYILPLRWDRLQDLRGSLFSFPSKCCNPVSAGIGFQFFWCWNANKSSKQEIKIEKQE